jgi:hypothetical protein
MEQIDIFIALLFIVMLILFIKTSVRQRPQLLLVLSINNIKIKGEFKMVQLTTTQFVNGTLAPQDRLGNPATVEPGSVSVSSSDPAVFDVETDPDNELNLKLVAKGPGVATLHFTADADMGEGVKPSVE